MDPGRTSGGIVRLRELIEAHPAAIAYDFRHFFGVSAEAIGGSVSWLEAVHLTSKLLRMTDSWLQADRNGWTMPVSQEWIVMAFTHDLHHQIAAGKKKIKPIPKPWPETSANKIGNTKGRTNQQVIAALRRMNSKES